MKEITEASFNMICTLVAHVQIHTYTHTNKHTHKHTHTHTHTHTLQFCIYVTHSNLLVCVGVCVYVCMCVHSSTCTNTPYIHHTHAH